MSHFRLDFQNVNATKFTSNEPILLSSLETTSHFYHMRFQTDVWKGQYIKAKLSYFFAENARVRFLSVFIVKFWLIAPIFKINDFYIKFSVTC